MKKIFFLLLFLNVIFLTAKAQPNLIQAKNVEATKKITLTNTSVVGISNDSSDNYKREDFLITESAAKRFSKLLFSSSLTNVFKRIGTDSVFYIKNGVGFR